MFIEDEKELLTGSAVFGMLSMGDIGYCSVTNTSHDAVEYTLLHPYDMGKEEQETVTLGKNQSYSFGPVSYIEPIDDTGPGYEDYYNYIQIMNTYESLEYPSATISCYKVNENP